MFFVTFAMQLAHSIFDQIVPSIIAVRHQRVVSESGNQAASWA